MLVVTAAYSMIYLPGRVYQISVTAQELGCGGNNLDCV